MDMYIFYDIVYFRVICDISCEIGGEHKKVVKRGPRGYSLWSRKFPGETDGKQ